MLSKRNEFKTMLENAKKAFQKEAEALNHDIKMMVRRMNRTTIEQEKLNQRFANAIEKGADATLELSKTVEEMTKKINFLEERLIILEMKRLYDHEPIVVNPIINNPLEPNIDTDLLKGNRGILDCPQITCDTLSTEIGYKDSTVSVFANDKESIINELVDILDGPEVNV